jgi:hypothetical protein
MKAWCIIFFTLFLVGCTRTHQSPSLTAEQAKTVALRLANEKAASVYHSQPFRDGQPAQFVAGRWLWVERQGYGHGDIQVTVELAADGSTNSVDLQLLDSRNLLSHAGRQF